MEQGSGRETFPAAAFARLAPVIEKFTKFVYNQIHTFSMADGRARTGGALRDTAKAERRFPHSSGGTRNVGKSQDYFR